ncbi:MAG TPA: D-2-hydroxyacid dehydrogenase [Dehalococcoidia bacterium]|nr:D-2-hydroxyacid dehydrogenase [Dehalococcoidia bacterium]
MTERRVNVTIAMPIADELNEAIRAADSRLNVTALTRAQRRVYRGGRPLWAGYPEPPRAEDESEEEARERLGPILRETEVLFTNPIVPDDIVERALALKWLQLTSAGVDRLLDAPVVRSQVTVTTASGIHAVPISEYVIGAMLAFAKGLPRAFRAQQERVWRPYWPEELEEKTVGVLGVGAIGARVIELSKALGMRVLASRRSATGRVKGEGSGLKGVDELLGPEELPYLLAESDYVVVAVPLTAESRGLIGESELRSMKPNAVIVNIGRGAIIDEGALVRALKGGWIAGAALDVFTQEPLSGESELWGLENVIVTPHISGGTPRYMERAVELFCDNLRRYVAGEPLRNVVDPARGY